MEMDENKMNTQMFVEFNVTCDIYQMIMNGNFNRYLHCNNIQGILKNELL